MQRTLPSSHLRLGGLRLGFPAREAAGSNFKGTRIYSRCGGIGSRSLCSSPTEHQAFLAVSAFVSPCTLLPSLLNFLQLRHEIVKPTDSRKALHPFVIPLAREKGSSETICLLRSPLHNRGDKLPVVITQDNGLILLARDVRELLGRRAAEAQFDADMDSAERDAIVAAVNTQEKICSGSERPDKKLPLNKYLALKVGSFPDVNEELSLMHLARGDETAALVAADRNARHHGTWGRSFMFQANLFRKCGREPEAKDAYRMALMSPLWSLGADPFSTAKQAGIEDVEAFTQKVIAMSEKAREVELQQGTRSVEEVAIERAEHLIDAVCLGAHPGWADIREQLGAIYTEGGLGNMAKFVSEAA